MKLPYCPYLCLKHQQTRIRRRYSWDTYPRSIRIKGKIDNLDTAPETSWAISDKIDLATILVVLISLLNLCLLYYARSIAYSYQVRHRTFLRFYEMYPYRLFLKNDVSTYPYWPDTDTHIRICAA
jgi:hypothetical protein